MGDSIIGGGGEGAGIFGGLIAAGSLAVVAAAGRRDATELALLLSAPGDFDPLPPPLLPSLSPSRFSSPSMRFRSSSRTSVLGPRFLGTASVCGCLANVAFKGGSGREEGRGDRGNGG